MIPSPVSVCVYGFLEGNGQCLRSLFFIITLRFEKLRKFMKQEIYDSSSRLEV